MRAEQGTTSAEESGEKAVFAWRDLGRTGVLAILWALLPALSTIFLVVYLGDVSAWFASRGALGAVLYAVAFAAASGAGLAPTYSLSFLAGWTFAFGGGYGVALGALLGAAGLGFAIAHVVSARHARTLVARFPRAEAVRADLVGRGPWRAGLVVALLRVPPNSPFSLTNLALGVSGVSVLPYLVGSLAGLAPRTAVYVAAGAVAAADGAESLGEALERGPGWPVLVVSVVLVLVVLNVIGKMAQRALDRITEGTERAA
ncbi:MAG: VTT domain-containing protein [Planctomycetota bacterium]